MEHGVIFSNLAILKIISSSARNVGVLMGFSAGALVEYENRPYIFVFFPIMFLIWLFSLPNTPQHYLHTEQFDVSFILDFISVNVSVFLFALANYA